MIHLTYFIHLNFLVACCDHIDVLQLIVILQFNTATIKKFILFRHGRILLALYVDYLRCIQLAIFPGNFITLSVLYYVSYWYIIIFKYNVYDPRISKKSLTNYIYLVYNLSSTSIISCSPYFILISCNSDFACNDSCVFALATLNCFYFIIAYTNITSFTH